MSQLDDLPTFGAREIWDLSLGLAHHLAHGELPVLLSDGPVIARELSVVENLGQREIGRALMCRVRFADCTRVYARIKITDGGVLRHASAQGASPGTVTEVCRDGILVALSLNTGPYREALKEAWAE